MPFEFNDEQKNSVGEMYKSQGRESVLNGLRGKGKTTQESENIVSSYEEQFMNKPAETTPAVPTPVVPTPTETVQSPRLGGGLEFDPVTGDIGGDRTPAPRREYKSNLTIEDFDNYNNLKNSSFSNNGDEKLYEKFYNELEGSVDEALGVDVLSLTDKLGGRETILDSLSKRFDISKEKAGNFYDIYLTDKKIEANADAAIEIFEESEEQDQASFRRAFSKYSARTIAQRSNYINEGLIEGVLFEESPEAIAVRREVTENQVEFGKALGYPVRYAPNNKGGDMEIRSSVLPNGQPVWTKVDSFESFWESVGNGMLDNQYNIGLSIAAGTYSYNKYATAVKHGSKKSPLKLSAINARYAERSIKAAQLGAKYGKGGAPVAIGSILATGVGAYFGGAGGMAIDTLKNRGRRIDGYLAATRPFIIAMDDEIIGGAAGKGIDMFFKSKALKAASDPMKAKIYSWWRMGYQTILNGGSEAGVYQFLELAGYSPNVESFREVLAESNKWLNTLADDAPPGENVVRSGGLLGKVDKVMDFFQIDGESNRSLKPLKSASDEEKILLYLFYNSRGSETLYNKLLKEGWADTSVIRNIYKKVYNTALHGLADIGRRDNYSPEAWEGFEADLKLFRSVNQENYRYMIEYGKRVMETATDAGDKPYSLTMGHIFTHNANVGVDQIIKPAEAPDGSLAKKFLVRLAGIPLDDSKTIDIIKNIFNTDAKYDSGLGFEALLNKYRYVKGLEYNANNKEIIEALQDVFDDEFDRVLKEYLPDTMETNPLTNLLVPTEINKERTEFLELFDNANKNYSRYLALKDNALIKKLSLYDKNPANFSEEDLIDELINILPGVAHSGRSPYVQLMSVLKPETQDRIERSIVQTLAKRLSFGDAKTGVTVDFRALNEEIKNAKFITPYAKSQKQRIGFFAQFYDNVAHIYDKIPGINAGDDSAFSNTIGGRVGVFLTKIYYRYFRRYAFFIQSTEYNTTRLLFKLEELLEHPLRVKTTRELDTIIFGLEDGTPKVFQKQGSLDDIIADLRGVTEAASAVSRTRPVNTQRVSLSQKGYRGGATFARNVDSTEIGAFNGKGFTADITENIDPVAGSQYNIKDGIISPSIDKSQLISEKDFDRLIQQRGTRFASNTEKDKFLAEEGYLGVISEDGKKAYIIEQSYYGKQTNDFTTDIREFTKISKQVETGGVTVLPDKSDLSVFPGTHITEPTKINAAQFRGKGKMYVIATRNENNRIVIIDRGAFKSAEEAAAHLGNKGEEVVSVEFGSTPDTKSRTRLRFEKQDIPEYMRGEISEDLKDIVTRTESVSYRSEVRDVAGDRIFHIRSFRAGDELEGSAVVIGPDGSVLGLAKKDRKNSFSFDVAFRNSSDSGQQMDYDNLIKERDILIEREKNVNMKKSLKEKFNLAIDEARNIVRFSGSYSNRADAVNSIMNAIRMVYSKKEFSHLELQLPEFGGKTIKNAQKESDNMHSYYVSSRNVTEQLSGADIQKIGDSLGIKVSLTEINSHANRAGVYLGRGQMDAQTAAEELYHHLFDLKKTVSSKTDPAFIKEFRVGGIAKLLAGPRSGGYFDNVYTAWKNGSGDTGGGKEDFIIALKNIQSDIDNGVPLSDSKNELFVEAGAKFFSEMAAGITNGGLTKTHAEFLKVQGKHFKSWYVNIMTRFKDFMDALGGNKLSKDALNVKHLDASAAKALKNVRRDFMGRKVGESENPHEFVRAMGKARDGEQLNRFFVTPGMATEETRDMLNAKLKDFLGKTDLSRTVKSPGDIEPGSLSQKQTFDLYVKRSENFNALFYGKYFRGDAKKNAPEGGIYDELVEFWKETGWTLSPNGRWMKFFTTKDIQLPKSPLEDIYENMVSSVDSPRQFGLEQAFPGISKTGMLKMYPELKNLNVEFILAEYEGMKHLDPNAKGFWGGGDTNVEQGLIRLYIPNTSRFKDDPTGFLEQMKDGKKPLFFKQWEAKIRKTLIHELNHNIQYYTGYATGGHVPKTYKRSMTEYEARAGELDFADRHPFSLKQYRDGIPHYSEMDQRNMSFDENQTRLEDRPHTKEWYEAMYEREGKGRKSGLNSSERHRIK